MPKSDQDTFRKVHETRAAVQKVFLEKWEEARENARFFRLLQYSDTQLQQAADKKRVPYVLDFTSLAINTQLGDQRANRTDIQYLPVEENDDLRVEVLNAVKDSILRQNNFQFLESDVFQDGLIEKSGYLGYEWIMDADQPGGAGLKMFRIPQRQMTWDLNRRGIALTESQWVSRTRLYSKRDLKKKYPDYKKEIDRMNISDWSDLTGLGLDASYLREILNTDLGAIAAVEFYERDYEPRYFLVADGEILEDYFKTTKEADKEIRERLRMWEQQLAPQLNQMGRMAPPPPNFKLKAIPKAVIYKTELSTTNVFVDTEPQDMPDFPYDVYHPYWHDGEWWSVMDLYKDPQKFINKMFAQIDHQIGTSSKGLLLVDDKIPLNQFIAAKNLWSTTGGAMQTSDVQGFVHIKPDSFDPKLVDAMNVAIGNLKEKSGGANFLGLQESSGESGTAIRQRVDRGATSSFVTFDNLTRFKKSVGEKIAWYITNYMTAAQKVRIEGDELTQLAQQEFPSWFTKSRRPGVGFLQINTTTDNTVAGIKVDVIVDEVKHSATKNQQTLAQLADMMRSSPNLAATIPPDLMIELLDLPASVKRDMKAQSQQLQQAELEKQKAEATKPPALSGALKDVTILSPQDQAQWLAKFGIQQTGPIQNDPTLVPVVKGILAQDQQAKDIAFKQGKHDDQIATKVMSLVSQHVQGNQKAELEAAKIASSHILGQQDAETVRSDQGQSDE